MFRKRMFKILIQGGFMMKWNLPASAGDRKHFVIYVDSNLGKCETLNFVTKYETVAKTKFSI